MSTTLAPDPIADLLFGKGRRELLALLFGCPDHQFDLRELARLTGASVGALRTLLEQTMGVPDLLRAALAPVADRLVFVGIYGSVARGTQKASSDVDVLAVGDVEFSEVSDGVARVEVRLDRPVNPTVYTPDQFKRSLEGERHFVASVLGSPFLAGANGLAGGPERLYCTTTCTRVTDGRQDN